LSSFWQHFVWILYSMKLAIRKGGKEVLKKFLVTVSIYSSSSFEKMSIKAFFANRKNSSLLSKDEHLGLKHLSLSIIFWSFTLYRNSFTIFQNKIFLHCFFFRFVKLRMELFYFSHSNGCTLKFICFMSTSCINWTRMRT